MPDVNPFEPWRPPDSRRQPDPDEDVRRPWQPADRVPSRRDREPEREPHWYAGPADRPAWEGGQRQMSTGQRWLIGLSIVLLLGGLVAIGLQGGTHVSRVAAAAMALWLGLLIALAVGGSWRWGYRLAWALAGVGGAVVCWYLVPTTGGVNLIEAHSRLHAIQTLPPGDVGRFRVAQAERRELSKQFPNWAGQVVVAERDWVHRTATEAARAAEAERGTDPAAAQERLRNLNDELMGVDHYHLVSQVMQSARRQTFAAQLRRLEADLGSLLREKQYQQLHARARQADGRLRGEAANLLQETELDEAVRQLRRRAVRQEADDGHTALQSLYERKEYEKVAEQGRRLLKAQLPMAESLEQGEYLRRPITNVRQRALAARLERAAAAVEAALRKKEYAAVADLARRHDAELRDEAAQLSRQADVRDRLLPLRRQALQARATAARATLDGLLAKQEFTAVAARGEELLRALQAEAADTGEEARLRESLVAVRRKAVSARLDEVRRQANALLRKDQYRAMGELGEKAYKELGVEAGSVGLAGDVVQFRDTCRVFADLAKRAGKDGD